MNRTNYPIARVPTFLLLLSLLALASCDQNKSSGTQQNAAAQAQSQSSEPQSSADNSTGETALPPEAQENLNKGLDAADQGAWTTALNYFAAAHKAAPYAPDPLKDQALAEINLGNRQLRAIVLLEAYLVAAPNAPDADAVRKQIADLKLQEQGIIEKLIKQEQAWGENDDGKTLLELGLHHFCYPSPENSNFPSLKNETAAQRIDRWTSHIDESRSWGETRPPTVNQNANPDGIPDLTFGDDIYTNFESYLRQQVLPPDTSVAAPGHESEVFISSTAMLLESDLNCIDELEVQYQ